MANLLSADQLRVMSPEGRVKNSYESLYYRAASGDPEMDEILRMEMQVSFKEHDVLLADQPEPEKLRQILLHAARESTKELQRSLLTPEQESAIIRDFDKLAGNQPRFYETVFDSFERRHHGEPVDFSAEFEREVKANGGKMPWEMEIPESVVEAMQDEYHARDREEQRRDAIGERVPRTILSPSALSAPKPSDEFQPVAKAKATPRSGLSYATHVPDAVAPKRKPVYAHARQEEAVAREQKGKFDRDYELHARRNKNAAKFTAGDGFGFDEPEDDGPEL